MSEGNGAASSAEEERSFSPAGDATLSKGSVITSRTETAARGPSLRLVSVSGDSPATYVSKELDIAAENEVFSRAAQMLLGTTAGAKIATRETDKDEPMADAVSREELTSRLETLEARAETRQVSLEGKLDRVLDQVANLGTKVEEAKSAAEAAKAATALTRWNVMFMVLGLFAAMVALVALGSALFDSAKSLFEMGAAAKP